MSFLVGLLSVAGFSAIEKPRLAQASATEIQTTELVSTQAAVSSESGLKISSETAYAGGIQGIFTGDTTLEFIFAQPHEGWFAGNFVFRVTDAVDETKYFDVEYKVGDVWDSAKYTKIGLTSAYVKYANEVRTAGQTGTTWYNAEVSRAVANNQAVICAPSMTINEYVTRVGLLKLGYDGNGNFAVTVNNSNNDNSRTIAAFDGTESFVSGTSWGLPEMPFANGYTISFSSEFTSSFTTDKATDVLFKSIKSGQNSYDLSQTTLQAPDFYTAYVSACDITIADHENFNGYVLGDEITVPAATYTSNTVTQPTAVTDIQIELPSKTKVNVAAGETYTIQEVGKHTVIYTVGNSKATFEFTTLKKRPNYAVDLFNLETTGATITQNEGVRVSSDEEYNGSFKGVFTGNTSIQFNFPETYDGWYGGNFIFRITDAMDESKYFDVEYRVLTTWESAAAGGTIGYTGVYVNYNGNIRSARYYGDVWYDTYKTNAETANFAPAFRNYRAQDGILQLVYESEKLTVKVNKNNSSDVKTIAVFDGTEAFADQKSWGLPEMPFTNGYTISFTSSFANAATEDKGTDVCFKKVITGNSTYDLTSKNFIETTYSFDLDIENATEKNGQFYIPCNEQLGKVVGTYSAIFGGGDWKITKSVDVTVTVDTSTIGAKNFTVVDDTFAEDWEEINRTYVLNVQKLYQLSFDVQGGDPIDPIYYSENTTDRVVIKDATRMFWVFDGWYVGDLAWSGDVSELLGKDAVLTAHWKDVEAPVIYLANGVTDVTVIGKGKQVVISTSDVNASDLAQPQSVSVIIELQEPDGAWTQIDSGSIKTWDVAGTYKIRYTAKDASNLTAQIERSIEVIERDAPTITPNGMYAQTGIAGTKIDIASVTALDTNGNPLTDITVTIVKDGLPVALTNNGFEAEEGVYTVTYTVEDTYGLEGIFSYNVTVVSDNIPPVISVDFADQEVSKGAIVSVPSATAQDDVSSNVTVDVKVVFGTQEVAMDNNTFKAEQEGVYTVVYTAIDGSGNVTEKRVEITVRSATSGCTGCNSIANGGMLMGILFLSAVGIIVAKKRKED